MNKQFFELTEDHIKLLEYSNINYSPHCEHGYIGLDCKRPFGNSNLVDDMANILEIEPVKTDDDEIHWPKGTSERMQIIFEEELPKALAIILKTKSFQPGLYECDEYYDNWRISTS